MNSSSRPSENGRPSEGAKPYRLLTAKQVADILQVPTSWIYEQSRIWEQTGGARGIPTCTLGRYRRYRPETVRQWLDDLKGAPNPQRKEKTR